MPDKKLSFVRTEMLDAEAPPVSQIGAVRWVRENLFSGPLNSILTVVSLYVIYWIIAHLGPWFTNAVWNAGSLAECRQILEGTTGACFAVIKDRWHQLLYGFYPNWAYWRPNLALVLLFVALSPLMFPEVPRKILWFSAIYPFLAYWLLWGGSIWGPLVVLGAIVLTLVATAAASRQSVFLGILVLVGLFVALFFNPVALIVWLLKPVLTLGGMLNWAPTAGLSGLVASSDGFFPIVGALSGGLDRLFPVGIAAIKSDQFGGFMISILIGITGIALSLPLGILLALGRKSDMFLIKTLSVGFIEFIRGVPLITLLFTASLLLNYFLPPGTNFDIILRVIIMVTLFSAAYLAEVIRGGLAALPRGQYEAADALGLDYWKSMRLIILPQALKISIPGIVNTFIGLFKDTTLVVFIGILDPIGLSNAIRADSNWNGIYWELFGFIGLMFFIFCFGMSRYSMFLEKRLKTDHR